MKKLIIIFGFFLPWVLCQANPMILLSANGEAFDPAPSGTYKFWYNGDHLDGVSDAWATNGTLDRAGTAAGGATVSSEYAEFSTVDEYISWNLTAVDIFEQDLGTIWLTAYVIDDGAIGTNTLFEAYADSTNYTFIEIDGSNVTAHRYDGANNQTVADAVSTAHSTYYRIGYSWQRGGGPNGDHAVVVAAGETAGSWTGSTDESEDLDAATDPTRISIGERDQSAAGGLMDDGVRVKDVIISAGYKDADQL